MRDYRPSLPTDDISNCVSPTFCRIRDQAKCPLLWRIQNQGGSSVAIFLQFGHVRRWRCASRLDAILCTGSNCLWRSIRYAVWARIQGNHPRCGYGNSTCRYGSQCAVCVQPQRGQRPRRGRPDRGSTASGACADYRRRHFGRCIEAGIRGNDPRGRSNAGGCAHRA